LTNTLTFFMLQFSELRSGSNSHPRMLSPSINNFPNCFVQAHFFAL